MAAGKGRRRVWRPGMRESRETKPKRSRSAKGYLVPAIVCPECGAPPEFWITPLERLRHADSDPDTPVQLYRCQSRGCSVVYRVPARAFREAS